MEVYCYSHPQFLLFRMRIDYVVHVRNLHHLDITRCDEGWEDIPMSALIQGF